MPWRTFGRAGAVLGAAASPGARLGAARAWPSRVPRGGARRAAALLARARRSASRSSGVRARRWPRRARAAALRSFGGRAAAPARRRAPPRPGRSAASSAGSAASAPRRRRSSASAGSSAAASGRLGGLGGLFGRARSRGSRQPSLLVRMSMPRSRATVSARARSRLAVPQAGGVLQLARWRAGSAGRTAPGARSRCARRARRRRGRAVPWPVIDWSSSRMTNLVLTGSLWPARRIASRARCSGTPASSNITRPGLTTATQPSGEPLPEPMRVSAGFLVTGLSGIDVDPDLAATLDLAGHRDTGGLDLAVGEPAGLERLEAVLAELHLGLAARQPGPAPAVLLAVLDALGGQHQRPPPPPRRRRRRRRGHRRRRRPPPPPAAATAAATAAAAAADRRHGRRRGRRRRPTAAATAAAAAAATAAAAAAAHRRRRAPPRPPPRSSPPAVLARSLHARSGRRRCSPRA